MKKGRKSDNGKPRWDLLPLEQVEEIVKVLSFGAIKYAPNQWQHVPNAENRYFAAMMRHIKAYQSGEIKDNESGLPHLAHAACCIIFIMWFNRKGEEK